jgi:hypothetical protein
MSRQRAKGTAWETAIVGYLRDKGWTHAERRALGGAQDKGDIAGVIGVVIEAKSCKTHDLAGWIDEAAVERDNADADLGVVWFKRRGYTSPGKGYVLMTGEDLAWLLKSAGYGPADEGGAA